MKARFLMTSIFFFFFVFYEKAQNKEGENPYIHYLDSIYIHDTIPLIYLPDLYVFPKVTFRDKEEELKFLKLVRDVKKTLPYAKLIYGTLMETYEYIETLPTQKAREAHLKRMEADLFADYKPVLKKMSYSQGRLLIKLINRECNQNSYDLIKAFMGNGRAAFWQSMGLVFNMNLKSEYDPKEKDRAIEEVVQMVEAGVL
ncbi:MAG: DUF4294 domain-containing protein [Candidatus Azobacteroides sp.]|nr:DUF4294 domain-containing protein [Candidatus Azobacteroides sp.]